MGHLWLLLENPNDLVLKDNKLRTPNLKQSCWNMEILTPTFTAGKVEDLSGGVGITSRKGLGVVM